MLKTITNIPIVLGLLAAINRLPNVKGTTYGKVASVVVYTIDAIGLVLVKNKVIDNTLKKQES